MPMNTKALLAALIPVSVDAPAPDKKPKDLKALSPVADDSLFYTYYVPNAVFQAKDGTIWDVENIADTGYVRIRNKWYPRQERTCLTSELRKFISAWIEPVQQAVPDLAE